MSIQGPSSSPEFQRIPAPNISPDRQQFDQNLSQSLQNIGSGNEVANAIAAAQESPPSLADFEQAVGTIQLDLNNIESASELSNTPSFCSLSVCKAAQAYMSTCVAPYLQAVNDLRSDLQAGITPHADEVQAFITAANNLQSGVRNLQSVLSANP